MSGKIDFSEEIKDICSICFDASFSKPDGKHLETGLEFLLEFFYHKLSVIEHDDHVTRTQR